ncbi:MAG: hypothetical protein AAF222_11630 [Pseudomonadota bacterium]
MRSFLAQLVVGAALCLPAPALARCSGAVAFGTLHDAYLATLVADPETQRRTAKTILVAIGGSSVDRMAHGLKRTGLDVDRARLKTALNDAASLAKVTLAGQRFPQEDTFHHSQNVSWLAKIFEATGCARSAETASAAPNYATRAAQNATDVTPIQGPHPLLLAGLAALALALGVAGYRFSRSFTMRRRQLERMPRFPISLPLSITFTDENGEMQQTHADALDISQGGLKAKWEDAPPPGILVTLELLGSQRFAKIAWANDFYAGIMFETALNKTELKALKETTVS